MAVAAAGHQAQKGRLQVRMGEVQRGDVPPQMVHRHQGLAGGKGQAFGKVHPHQHCADEARRVGDGHGADVFQGTAGLVQGALGHGADMLDVAAGGDLRHLSLIHI